MTAPIVERLAQALEDAWLARGYGEGDQWNYLADTALRATYHTELSSELKRLVTRVQLAIKSGQLAPSFANQCLDDARALLAKLNGDQP
jgi:uncharacterized protein (DUF2164 family)